MEDNNKKSYKKRVYKIIALALFVPISLIVAILLFVAVNFDNDKSCQSSGGIWNEDKSRCEDEYGNKWKF